MKFSIITITFNDIKGLTETIESTSIQKYRNYEQIIIDGASNDGTCKYLADLDIANLSYISEKDSGLYDAMNKGIKMAQGDFIIFMNGGDNFCDENTLFEINRLLEIKDYDFIYGDSLEKNNLNNLLQYKKAFKHNMIWYGMFTHHQAMVFKRDIILKNEILYNLNYSIAADYDFTIRFLKRGLNYAYYSSPICIFLAGGESSNWLQGMKEQFKIRRVTLKYNYLYCMIIAFIHFLRKSLNLIFPSLYKIIRFNRSTSNNN